VIVDNDHCDKGVWNNHGSLIEFKDQWYVFYHRSTHGSSKMRKACVERVVFKEDGSIPEVEMTTQGAGPPLDPLEQMDAAGACVLHGEVMIGLDGPANEILMGIESGDRALFRYFLFTGKEKRVRIRARTGGQAVIRVTADSPWNPTLSTLELNGKGHDDWQILAADLKSVSGTRAIWLSFRTDEPGELSVDWIQFD
jgi:hypothetical protein